MGPTGPAGAGVVVVSSSGKVLGVPATTFYYYDGRRLSAPGFVTRGATVVPTLPDDKVISSRPATIVYYQHSNCTGRTYLLEPNDGMLYSNELYWIHGSSALYGDSGIDPTGTFEASRAAGGPCNSHDGGSLAAGDYFEITDAFLALDVNASLPWSIAVQ